MLYDMLINTPPKIWSKLEEILSFGQSDHVPSMPFSRKILEGTTLYGIDGIADYYYDAGLIFDPEDLRNIAPRRNWMWFEYLQPRHGKDAFTGEIYDLEVMVDNAKMNCNLVRRGVLLRAWDRHSPEDASLMSHLELPDNVRWVMRGATFLTFNMKYLFNLTNCIAFRISDAGSIVPYGVERPFYYQTFDNHLSLDENQTVREITLSTTMPVLLTLSMLNSPDVPMRQIRPRKPKKPAKLGTRQARRQTAKLKRDERFRAYNVLDIDLGKPGQSLGRKPRSSNDERHISRHAVSGHFKTYGKPDPVTGRERGKLFGKVEGTIFFSSHERGDEGQGKIEKDYVITRSKEDV